MNYSFFTTGDGARIAYRLEGPEEKPVLVLSNSIATNIHMWDDQVTEFTKNFRLLRFDTRGHGASSVPEGPYSIERMGRDVVELLDFLKIQKVYFLGLSLGGTIGQWLGVHVPERIEKLVLSNTSPYIGPAKQWNDLIASIKGPQDMPRMADMFISNWFPATMLNDKNNDELKKFRAMVLATSPSGLKGSFAAVRDVDMRRTVALITAPTLVIVGVNDRVTLPSHGEQVASAIPNARLIRLSTVHLSNVELPVEFIRIVTDFLQE
jgi:3-oxoadipate enol-lactonase